MPEQKVEKKIDGQDGTVQMLTEQLRKLQEKAAEREKNLISDLEVKHAEEIRILRHENAGSEKKLVSDLVARYVEETRILQEENADKEKKLISALEVKHAQEIQKLQAQSTEREKILLNDAKAKHQARFHALVVALLRTKSERDRILLAVSWIVVVAIAAIAFSDLNNGILSKVFTFAALAGFIGAISFIGQSIKRNSRRLKRVTEDPYPIWEEDDSRPSRFLIFGFISAVCLGLTLFIKSPVKVTILPPTTGPSTQKSVALQDKTSSDKELQPVLSPAASVTSPKTSPVASHTAEDDRKVAHDSFTPTTSAVKTTGNGGNFIGGGYGKQ